MTLNVGDRIRHTTFGEGLVTKYEPSTGDVIITIAFDSNNEIKRFLLNHTPMEKIEECNDNERLVYTVQHEREIKALPEKIKEPQSPRTYTTEFKIKVVKQALSEGRAVVRKQHDLPEATLRRWIKELG